jgi:hypothetical protein
MREGGRQSPGVFVRTPGRGVQKRCSSSKEFAELKRSDTEEGGGVAEGERLRWDG